MDDLPPDETRAVVPGNPGARPVEGDRLESDGVVHVLDPAEPDGAGGGRGGSGPSERRWVIAVGVSLVVGLGALLIWLTTPDLTAPPAPTAPTAPIATPDTETDDDAVSVPEGIEAAAAAWDGERFWILGRRTRNIRIGGGAGDAVVVSLDRSGAVLTETSLSPETLTPTGATAIVADDDGVWVTGGGTLLRLDPVDGALDAEIPLIAPADVETARFAGRLIVGFDAVIADGSVWVLAPEGAVARVDIAGDELVDVTVMRTTNPRAMFTSPGSVWVAPPTPDAPLVRIITATGTTTAEPVEGLTHRAVSGAVDGDDLYLAGDGLVSRVDLTSLSVAETAELDNAPAIFARIDGMLGLLDPAGFIPVSDRPGVVAAAWTSNWSPGTETFSVDTDTWTVRPGGRVLERLTADPPQTDTMRNVASVRLPAGMVARDAAWDGSDRIWVIVEPPGGRPPAIDAALEMGSLVAGADIATPFFDIATQPSDDGAQILSIVVGTDEVLTITDLFEEPLHIAAAPEGVWVAHWATGEISRLDPETGDVVAVIAPDLGSTYTLRDGGRQFRPNQLGVAGTSVWMSTARGALAEIAIDNNEIVAVDRLDAQATSFVVGDETVWVAITRDAIITVDRSTRALSTLVDQLDHETTILGFDGTDLYVGNDINPMRGGVASRVSRIDPTTGEIVEVEELTELVAAIGSVEGVFGALDTLGRLHPLGDTGQATRPLATNYGAGGKTFEVGGDLWAIWGDGSLRRIIVTGIAPEPLPIAIPQQSGIRRPVPDEQLQSPDWERLDPGPLSEQRLALIEWTGESIVAWGSEVVGEGVAPLHGAAFDPGSGTWSETADAPIGRSGGVSWISAGDELFVWTHLEAVSWSARTDTWRRIEEWPLAPGAHRAVWTGEEIIDIDAGIAIDPATGTARRIARPPHPLALRSTVVVADGLLVVVPEGGAYDIGADSWIDTPPSGLTPLAADGTWTGTELFAADYEMGASGYDPATNRWAPYPDVPLRFFECIPEIESVNGRPFVQMCSGNALWDDDAGGWLTIPDPTPDGHFSLIASGDAIYARGADGFFRLRDEVLEAGPSRLALNTSLLDVPDGWDVGSVTAETSVTGIEGPVIATGVLLTTPDGEACRVVGIYGAAEQTLRRFVVAGSGVVSLGFVVGGKPAEALRIPGGAIDDRHHLVWATDTTDVVDVGCSSEAATMTMAASVWSPWH